MLQGTLWDGLEPVQIFMLGVILRVATTHNAVILAALALNRFLFAPRLRGSVRRVRGFEQALASLLPLGQQKVWRHLHVWNQLKMLRRLVDHSSGPRSAALLNAYVYQAWWLRGYHARKPHAARSLALWKHHMVPSGAAKVCSPDSIHMHGRLEPASHCAVAHRLRTRDRRHPLLHAHCCLSPCDLPLLPAFFCCHGLPSHYAQ